MWVSEVYCVMQAQSLSERWKHTVTVRIQPSPAAMRLPELGCEIPRDSSWIPGILRDSWRDRRRSGRDSGARFLRFRPLAEVENPRNLAESRVASVIGLSSTDLPFEIPPLYITG